VVAKYILTGHVLIINSDTLHLSPIGEVGVRHAVILDADSHHDRLYIIYCMPI